MCDVKSEGPEISSISWLKIEENSDTNLKELDDSIKNLTDRVIPRKVEAFIHCREYTERHIFQYQLLQHWETAIFASESQ
jgi:hypothetical protein